MYLTFITIVDFKFIHLEISLD